MATYKKPCVHCGAMIGGEDRHCAKCGNASPFGFKCPNCLKSVKKGDAVCSGCGRSMTTVCPYCGREVFAGDNICDGCLKQLTVNCDNKKCGGVQFFENKTCALCGKPLKTADKQIEKNKKSGGF